MAKQPSTRRAIPATSARDQTKPRAPTLAATRKAELLALAQRMVDSTTSEQASGFDTERWLKQWLRQPQPALGGARPIDLLGTEVGTQTVRQVLAAMESGAYL